MKRLSYEKKQRDTARSDGRYLVTLATSYKGGKSAITFQGPVSEAHNNAVTDLILKIITERGEEEAARIAALPQDAGTAGKEGAKS